MTERTDRLLKKKSHSVRLIGRIESNIHDTMAPSDLELRKASQGIFPNHGFQYHRGQDFVDMCITNDVDSYGKRICSDEVFQKIREVYDGLMGLCKTHGCNDFRDPEMFHEPVIQGLNELVYQMVTRTMTQYTYEDIQNDLNSKYNSAKRTLERVRTSGEEIYSSSSAFSKSS